MGGVGRSRKGEVGPTPTSMLTKPTKGALKQSSMYTSDREQSKQGHMAKNSETHAHIAMEKAATGDTERAVWALLRHSSSRGIR